MTQLLGPDGARLAKRHGAVTLADRAAQGQGAAQLRTELAASVGLCAPDERPEPAEHVTRFDRRLLEQVGLLYEGPIGREPRAVAWGG